MHRIHEQIRFATLHELFRSASASEVICSMLPQILQRRNSLPAASQVDCFISHSWSCPSWMKILAICHHLNLKLAIGLSLFASLLAALVLVLRVGSLSGVAQMSQSVLYMFLVCWPMCVFLLAYLFGHLCFSKRFWFDQACVDQVNTLTKVNTLQAIAAFIAQSTELLILWDETLFDRLWCNYELAVHAKTSASDAFYVVAIWEPIWTLTWLCLWCAVMCLAYSAEDDKKPFDATSQQSLFVSFWNAYYDGPAAHLIFSFPCFWFCLQKLKRHKVMLDQMSKFEIRNAKCTLQTDRSIIIQHVLGLFDEAFEPPISVVFGESAASEPPQVESPLISAEDLQEIRPITSYPTKDETLDLFNAYVRGPLRDAVIRSTGREDHISLSLCMVTSLPLFFNSLVNVLGCDGQTNCGQAAANFGCSSIFQYMLANVIMGFAVMPLCLLIVCPLMLRASNLAIQLISDSFGTQLILGSFLCAAVLFSLDCFMLAECGMILVTCNTYSHLWSGGCIAGFVGLLLGVWCLFGEERPRASTLQRAAILRRG